jgi:UDP-glucose 4-epimerase
LLDLVSSIEAALGRAVPIRWEPPRGYDVPTNVLDIRRAAAELGWRPTVGFEEGVARTVRALELPSS